MQPVRSGGCTLFIFVDGVAVAIGRHSDPQLTPFEGLLPGSSAAADTPCPLGPSFPGLSPPPRPAHKASVCACILLAHMAAHSSITGLVIIASMRCGTEPTAQEGACRVSLVYALWQQRGRPYLCFLCYGLRRQSSVLRVFIFTSTLLFSTFQSALTPALGAALCLTLRLVPFVCVPVWYSRLKSTANAQCCPLKANAWGGSPCLDGS